jgi:hypothetical protein
VGVVPDSDVKVRFRVADPPAVVLADDRARELCASETPQMLKPKAVRKGSL